MKALEFYKHKQLFSAFKSSGSNGKQFLFHVDSPTNQETICSDFQITGWCISTVPIAIKTIRAKVRNKTFSAIYGLPRPRMALVYKDHKAAEFSALRIAVNLFTGKYNIKIEAQDFLEKWHILTLHTVTVSSVEVVILQPLSPSLTDYSSYRKNLRKKIERFLKFGTVVVKQVLEKQRELGHFPTLKEMQKIGKWLKKLYKQQLEQSVNFVVSQSNDTYQAWLAVNQRNEKASKHLKNRLKDCQSPLPQISVVMPVFNPEIRFLEEWAIQSRVGIFDHKFPDTGPSVAIIIPTKNQVELLRQCLLSLQKTTYQNCQIIIIDNESDDHSTLAFFKSLPHKVLRIKNPATGFNFAAINNRAAEQVNSDYLLFLNNDTEVISPNWLSQMVSYAQFEGVVAVGAKLLYPDGRIQHPGVIHDLHRRLACPALKLLPSWNNGYLSYSKVARNYSAVTAACLLTPRQLFLKFGGFDQQEFGVAYNDADYCYRLVENNYRCVYCPSAELTHHEGKSRGFVDHPHEQAAYRHKYSQKIDSFYSPHLSLDNEQFQIQPRRFFQGEVSPLKVLMSSSALNLTGAPNTQYEIAINLVDQGQIKPIVFSTSDGPLRKAYEERGIEVIIHEHPLAKGNNIESYNQGLENLQKEISRHNIDVIYANTLETFFSVDCASKMNIPCVWNVHESQPWRTYFNDYGFQIAKRALECFSVPYKIIFGSDATRNLYLALNSRHNFTVVHSVLDLNRLKQNALKWQRKEAR